MRGGADKATVEALIDSGPSPRARGSQDPVAAAGLTRFMSSLLYGVEAMDPVTFATVAVMLTAIALVASYVPAVRASRIDPLEALRFE